MEIEIRLGGGKKVDAHFDGYTVHTDQPAALGGTGSAPSPFDLFLASIGTCAGYFVQNYCQSRGLPTEGLRIVQRMTSDPVKHRITGVHLDIEAPQGFPEQYLPSLVSAVNLCTVKKHLLQPPALEVTTRLAAPAAMAAV